MDKATSKFLKKETENCPGCRTNFVLKSVKVMQMIGEAQLQNGRKHSVCPVSVEYSGPFSQIGASTPSANDYRYTMSLPPDLRQLMEPS